jgi:sterol desaturase/sphingolipid hydroxylase (fatty acid hydroxylase superfamily)
MTEFIYIGFWVAMAFVYGGLSEWALHKYVLHGLGKRKSSIFSFHWHSHHKICRRNKNRDDNYLSWPPAPPVRKEILALFLLVWAHIIFLFIQPYFFGGLMVYTVRYFYMHRKAHTNIEWCKKNIPWHYDHHMGKNQDANYGVTVEWPDKLFGTRVIHWEGHMSEGKN